MESFEVGGRNNPFVVSTVITVISVHLRITVIVAITNQINVARARVRRILCGDKVHSTRDFRERAG